MNGNDVIRWIKTKQVIDAYLGAVVSDDCFCYVVQINDRAVGVGDEGVSVDGGHLVRAVRVVACWWAARVG